MQYCISYGGIPRARGREGQRQNQNQLCPNSCLESCHNTREGEETYTTQYCISYGGYRGPKVGKVTDEIKINCYRGLQSLQKYIITRMGNKKCQWVGRNKKQFSPTQHKSVHGSITSRNYQFARPSKSPKRTCLPVNGIVNAKEVECGSSQSLVNVDWPLIYEELREVRAFQGSGAIGGHMSCCWGQAVIDFSSMWFLEYKEPPFFLVASLR